MNNDKMRVLRFIILPVALLFGARAEVSAQTVEENIEAGREAFLNYDFGEAAARYAAARKKARKNIPAELEECERQLMKAENFLERVEKLVILDSISVPKAEFFRHFKIPFSSGTLSGAEGLPFAEHDVDYVFTNEGDDFKMWAQPDSTGLYTIRESIRLTDGQWHEPTDTPEILGNGGNAMYPFMMPDGVTLYYASDNEESLGGLDIFVATRDAADGEYLQPQNIGMPYNSPYDDYLLAIDELNGVGWWATDRNQLGDDITIYVFKVNDLRANYNPEETEDLGGKARLTNWRSTWGDEDYTALVEEVREIVPGPAEKKGDFIFPMKGGRVYTVLDDFRTSSGREMMKKYLAAKKTFDGKLSRLGEMRRKYADNRSATLRNQIRTLESETEKDRQTLKRLRSDVYRAETSRH